MFASITFKARSRNSAIRALSVSLDGKGGSGFAKKVAAKMKKFGPLEERHITGLTDQAIKEIFVAPPIQAGT
jgi:hypothetical protein